MKHTSKLLALLAVALLVPNAGCNDPLRVSIPDIVPPGALSDSAALATVRAGAIGDFAIAYSGDHPDGSGGTGEGVIMYGGLLADEWINSETFPTRIEVDARTIALTNSDVDLWFRLLHRARNSAETAAARYASTAPADPGHPEMLSLAGLTYIFFAETYCSGVPVSTLNPDGSITYGQPLSRDSLLQRAIGFFNTALTVSTDPDMTSLASVGKGRALLDEGNFAAAATAVAGVPTGFVYKSEHSENTTRQENGVFNGNAGDIRYSVADSEGGNGFPFRSVPDPRTTFFRPTGSDSVGFDGSTPQFDNLRFGDRKASIPVATGVEARLIQAEAALQAGDTGTGGAYLTALNNPRTTAASRGYWDPSPGNAGAGTTPIPAMAALTTTDITNAGGAVNLLFGERARWLWLTAHRLGDLRRLIRQYSRPANTVFPVGPYFKSNFPTYGVDVNIPVPVTEKNNPNFAGCLDRLP
jgi:hypothetical protein